MDSVSLKQITKFSGERKHFPVWLTKATAICALDGVSPTLKAGFKDMLGTNSVLNHGFREFKTDSKVQRKKKATPSLVNKSNSCLCIERG